MSELDDLVAQLLRLGVAGHAHDEKPLGDCPSEEVCVYEEEAFSSLVRAPRGATEVHVDTMTAFGVLSDLPDGAGFEAAWSELREIDRGT